MSDLFEANSDAATALLAAGWTVDDHHFLPTLRNGGAFWSVGGDATSTLWSGDWIAEFDRGTPVIVVVAACLAAAGQTAERLADVIPIRPTP
ncbi:MULTISPECIES: hypothetical protein [Streptomyces]|uniref:Uncharacterized protein n=1 Tax=Streptomyces dengpaensis TaxID=2049881 RepID=A0ABN5I9T6_9ACTN|nr:MULTISPECIES: hypothetical protein [Streptomyces]AVH59945.1 hypothetical protein C4B68_33890 [Streptomyces dengpaensis]PIB09580.1 hypothetical protein B1C81_10565 [Streptomyces sp. HG99]